MGYFGITLFCLFDKKGKEIYFEDDTTETEYRFGDPNILIMKEFNPYWTIATDDWGYFYRFFERATIESSTLWKEYNVFEIIVITVGITGLLWIILTVANLLKYRYKKWNLADCVRVI